MIKEKTMKIPTLALKDLRQMLLDKNSALFLVAMPIVFTLFMGFAYGSGENGATEDPRIPLAWVMTGLQNILIRGLDLASLWQPIAILLAYALGFFILAVWRFQKMEV